MQRRRVSLTSLTSQTSQTSSMRVITQHETKKMLCQVLFLKSPFPSINRRQRPPSNARPLNKESFKLMHLNALAFIATYSLILTNSQNLHSSSLYAFDASISLFWLGWRPLVMLFTAVNWTPMISLCSRKRGSTHYSATISTAVNQHCTKVPLR